MADTTGTILMSTPKLQDKSSEQMWNRRKMRKLKQELTTKKRATKKASPKIACKNLPKDNDASKNTPATTADQIISLVTPPQPSLDDSSSPSPADPTLQIDLFQGLTSSPSSSSSMQHSFSPSSLNTSFNGYFPTPNQYFYVSKSTSQPNTITYSISTNGDDTALSSSSDSSWFDATSNMIPSPPSMIVESSAPEGVWLWWNDSEFVPFSAELSDQIERAYKEQQNVVSFTCTNLQNRRCTYTIFFDTLTQRNDSTGYVRQVTRRTQRDFLDESHPEDSSFELPVNRFNIDQSIGIQYPGEWESQEHSCELKLLCVQSMEFERILKMIRASLPSIGVVSVHRIQNQHLWRRYFLERQFVAQKNGGRANEMELFHGTRTTDPIEIFNGEEGFDMRYSNQGRWGVGIYFATKASYSIHYAFQIAAGANGVKQLLLSRVATGSAFSCLHGDSTLRRPPPKKTSNSRIFFAKDFHDSVVGVSGSNQIYTVYSNSKAYPSYLITLK